MREGGEAFWNSGLQKLTVHQSKSLGIELGGGGGRASEEKND